MSSAGSDRAFAVWLTGLPASGKSALCRALLAELAPRGVDPAVLESDALRPVLMPQAGYGAGDRDAFYGAIAWIGALLVRHGVPVVIDATANLRRYRDAARAAMPRFLEVHVTTPLEVCEARDPKGIYARGRADPGGQVPGVQAPYEPPLAPELSVDGRQDPALGARAIAAALEGRGWI